MITRQQRHGTESASAGLSTPPPQKRVESAKRAAKALALCAADVQPGQGYLSKLKDLADRTDREISLAKVRGRDRRTVIALPLTCEPHFRLHGHRLHTS